MKPYDPQARCAKCGGEQVRAWWRESTKQDFSWDNRHRRIVDEEYLHRTCERCGYAWAEACVEEGEQA